MHSTNNKETEMKDALTVLLSQTKRPLLTIEEEIHLAWLLRSGGEGAQQARKKLFEHNIGLVASIAKKFGPRSREDLIGEGILGLERALEHYDPRTGYRFSTYATFWIMREIRIARINFYNERNVARIPIYLIEALSKLEKLIRRSPELEDEPEALAIELEISREGIEDILFARMGGYIATSLDDISDDHPDTPLKDLIPEPTVETRLADRVTMLTDLLTDEEVEVLQLSCCDGLTMSQVASELNISVNRVRGCRRSTKRKIEAKYPTFAHVSLDP
ncbi:MAG: sigma-70 family RNA polymerase sigma factor [Candidatus Berkelbacteria bacterium]|nr:sigma-70 family RNA polymerase sigma factor [Candidatus Berkelbacteria bacterium]